MCMEGMLTFKEVALLVFLVNDIKKKAMWKMIKLFPLRFLVIRGSIFQKMKYPLQTSNQQKEIMQI